MKDVWLWVDTMDHLPVSNTMVLPQLSGIIPDMNRIYGGDQ